MERAPGRPRPEALLVAPFGGVEALSARSVFRDHGPIVELVVDAGSDDVIANAAVGGYGAEESACCADNRQNVGRAAEIEVQIFELAGPIPPQVRLDARADRPAALAGAEGGHRVDPVVGVDKAVGLLDAAPGAAARDVQQIALVGPAEAATRRREPLELVLHERRADGSGSRLADEAAADPVTLAGPLGVGLDAEHEAPDLPVVAELPAENSA